MFGILVVISIVQTKQALNNRPLVDIAIQLISLKMNVNTGGNVNT